MTKEEKKDELKNRISMALQDPILQQGFEIICKNLAEQEEKIADIKANCDYILEGKDLEIKTLGERCNQLLKDKGKLTDKVSNQAESLRITMLEEEKKNRRIAELEQENTELKNRDCWKSCEYANPKAELIGQHIKDIQNLTKAKEIIRTFLNMPMPNNEEVFADVGAFLTKAEQFLKEIEK